MKKLFLTTTFHLLLLFTALAEVTLPAIVSTNMVLQRNTTVELWGWADSKEKITISASWLSKPIETKADKNGEWRVTVETTSSKTPQNIQIKSKSSDINLENVLFGEVWLCSGQSNMQQPMKGYAGQPTYESRMAIAKSRNTNLRLFTVERVGSKTQMSNIEKYKGWEQASPSNVADFSAVAYFFGEQLQEILDCPVGIIHTSWGGSSVQAWMSKEALSGYENTDLEEVDITKTTQRIPTALFNAMINPLIHFKIKGALWYQGESNRLEPEKYKELFPAMVKDWRSRWNIGDFPFYYVQIAPFIYGGNEAFSTPENSAFMREAQLQCLDLIPNTGVAITTDIGAENFIHPPKKKEVADRLLYNALHQTYGYETIDYASPIYETLEVKENTIILKFKNAENGLYAYGGLEGFEIAGEDKVFHPAEAKIVARKNISVRNDKVPNPVAVRYAWRNWVKGTLFGTNQIPVSSFRTDEWDEAARSNTLPSD